MSSRSTRFNRPNGSGRITALPGALVPFPLDLQEMGLPSDLVARVQSNDPCPALEQGPGRLVLSTVNHLNNDVWEVEVVDQHGRAQTIRPTGSHKVYSTSRGAWVSTKSLRQGEQLDGVFGAAAVRTVAHVPGCPSRVQHDCRVRACVPRFDIGRARSQ